MAATRPNKVSWATGPNLCQVKHFLEEDCPSKVGSGSQHHLQLKRTHPSIIRSSSEGRQCLKQSKEKLSYRSLAKWKCPPKFNLNEEWLVVAGEESKEAEDQEHRGKRVLEAAYPSRSAIPPNPCTSSDLEQYYDDNQTPVIRTIPIEEEAVVEVPFHLTPSPTISSKSPAAGLPNSPSSSVSIVTSQKLPANEKSVPQSLSTFQNSSKPPSNSPFSVRWPSHVQSAPLYLSRYQNLKGSSQTQVSPKPPVNYNSVPQYRSTFKNLTTPEQTEIFPDQPANHSTPDETEIFPHQPANQNHVPKYRTVCGNQNISQIKSQVSGKPPANHNPVTQFPSMCDNPDQTEIVPDQPVCESRVSGMPPANHNTVTQFPSTCENPKIPGLEQGSLIDASLLLKLLLNPEVILNMLNAQGLATTDPKPGKVINEPINEYQAPHAGSGPIFGAKPMAKSVPLTMIRPETSVKSNLANEQGAPPHVGTANIRGSKPLVQPTSDLHLEKIKKLINEYGAPDNVVGKPLANSELVPSSCSKYDVALSSIVLPTTLQPKLQIMSVSPNAVHTSPFSSMTSPAPLHKDINYCKSLIKQHGENCASVVDEHLQSIIPRRNTRGPGLLSNQKLNQCSQKPCAFFNKPRGCLKGSACLFLHDVSGQKRSGGMLEAQDPKRTK